MSWVVFMSLPGTRDLGLDAGLSVLLFGTIGIIIVQGGIGIYPVIVAETLLVYDIPKTTGFTIRLAHLVGTNHHDDHCRFYFIGSLTYFQQKKS